MKAKLTILLLFISIAVFGQIDSASTGTGPNTGTGDPLRTALIKLNKNDRYFLKKTRDSLVHYRDTLLDGKVVSKHKFNTEMLGKISYSDTASNGKIQTKYQTTQSLAGKQNSLTLTTNGTSGAATLIGSTLNIPQYSSGGGTWGSITGTLSSQTDLQNALNSKLNKSDSVNIKNLTYTYKDQEFAHVTINKNIYLKNLDSTKIIESDSSYINLDYIKIMVNPDYSQGSGTILPTITVGNDNVKSNIITNTQLTSPALFKVYKLQNENAFFDILNKPVYLKTTIASDYATFNVSVFARYYKINRKFESSATLLPETELLIGRYSTTLTNAQKELIDSTIRMLKDSAIWAKSDILYVGCINDSVGSLQNWIKNAHNMTPVGGLRFVNREGWLFNGTNSFLNTNYTPSTSSVNYSQNSASWVLKKTLEGAGNKYDFATVRTGTSQTNTGYYSINGGTSNIFINGQTQQGLASSIGVYGASRTSSTTIRTFFNGAFVSQNTSSTSDPLSDYPFWIGAMNNKGSGAFYSAARINVFWAGSALTDVQQRAFYNIINWFYFKAQTTF